MVLYLTLVLFHTLVDRRVVPMYSRIEWLEPWKQWERFLTIFSARNSSTVVQHGKQSVENLVLPSNNSINITPSKMKNWLLEKLFLFKIINACFSFWLMINLKTCSLSKISDVFTKSLMLRITRIVHGYWKLFCTPTLISWTCNQRQVCQIVQLNQV